MFGKLWRRRPGAAPPVSENAALLLENLQQAVLQIDGSWIICYAGGAWYRLTDQEPEQAAGLSFLEYVHPEDRASCRHFLERVLSGANPDQGEGAGCTLRLLSPGEVPRWLLLRADLLPPRHGPNAGLVGTLADVTECVQAEAVAQARYRSLESLLDHVPGMLYRCRNDRDWTMEYVSEGGRALCGSPPGELVDNRRSAYTALIHPEDRNMVWDEVQAALRENRDFELHYRLRAGNGRMRRVLERGRGVFSASGMLLGLEGIVLDLEHSSQAEWRTLQRGLYEEYSGLSTPALFLDRLRMAACRAQAAGQGFILLLLGVDHWEQTRQRLGETDGTLLIRELGRRLAESLGPLDSVSLLEDGEQYAVLLAAPPEVSPAAAVARRLQEQAQAPLLAGQAGELQVTVSIGIVLEEDGRRDADALLVAARAALSRARHLGGARFELEDPRSHALAALRGVTARELEAALRDGELRLHWQPVIDLARGTPCALESRMVWPHPRRGLLFAEQFVPDLEDSRQVTALWEWVFEEMQRQMESWHCAGDLPALPGGILVSGTTLLDVDSILLLAEFLLSGRRGAVRPPLVLGTTEAVLGVRSRAVEGMLRRIRGSGIRLLLDDFGAGDTALLWRWQCIDWVRLSLHAARDEEQLARLAGLAQQLDLAVLAHQVDQPERLEILRRAGVNYVQGKAVAPLLEPGQVPEYLAAQTVPARAPPDTS